MSETIVDNVQSSIQNNPRYRFWFWQVGFWFFMSVVGFFTLTLWYSEVTAASVGHIGMQAILGLGCSLLLHQALTFLSQYNFILRTSCSLILVLISALIWTTLHMEFFVLITGFAAVWEEFGGWYFSGIFVFLCWTGLFHGIRYYELHQYEHRILLQAEANTRKEQLKRIQAQSEARDAKLKMLRYQLNPHFLCNTLNAINSLIEIGESQKAQEMTVQLSDFLRYSLDNDPDGKIPLSEEIDALNLYLKIEQTRFDERLQVNIDISETAKKVLVPNLILQPIIENSMKHAIAKNENGGRIEIKAKVDNSHLHIEMSDTGANDIYTNEPMENKHKSHKSVGLNNTKQRLKALYDDNFQIQTRMAKNSGLVTKIVLPVE